MQLAHGQTKCIYNLRSLRSKTFCINDPHLFESVFKITYFGRQFTEGRIRHVPENINTDFNYISRKLSKVFGIDDDEIKKRSYSLKRSRTIMENKLRKNDEELTLAKSLSLLLRACWSDS
jgi:hypothetical protein